MRISSRRLRRGLRVLIVDHHPGSRRILHFALSARRHVCVAFECVTDALKAMEDVRPEVVVYDWTGVDAASAAARFRERSRCPLVVVVTSVLEEPASLPIEAIDAFFVKPIAMREVIERIETLARDLIPT